MCWSSCLSRIRPSDFGTAALSGSCVGSLVSLSEKADYQGATFTLTFRWQHCKFTSDVHTRRHSTPKLCIHIRNISYYKISENLHVNSFCCRNKLEIIRNVAWHSLYFRRLFLMWLIILIIFLVFSKNKVEENWNRLII